MVFRFVFLVLALVSLVCLVLGLKVKRLNIGFLFTLALVAVTDIICFFLLGCKGVTMAKNALIAFYACHAWLGFGLLWTVVAMDRYRHSRRYLIPSGLICIYQTILMVSNFFGSRIMSCSKHILLGRTWWIAEGSRSSALIFSLRAYHALFFAGLLLIMVALVVCCLRSAKLFRGRFYALILAQAVFTAVEAVGLAKKLPVWIPCIVINLICVFSHYFVHYYSRNKLRDWSVMSFANEMSDGFILYNEYDDPIHMNDLLKRTLPGELVSSFRDKANLDEWISHTSAIENIEVLTCEGKAGDIYFKVKKTELNEHGSYLGTIYILHDTTESILQMRAMEEANRELERAAKMKSDFLANMSHEIRTPMNAVIGMAEIALREDLPSHVVDYLTQIQHSGRNLLNIINDILDFSKIEAGKMEIIPERYEPLSELNDIANVLATRIGDKNLELFVTVDTDVPHALEGDAMRIRQIIINLANNAIKFTKEGIVHVRVSCEKISGEEVMLTYHVIDTGTGIKEEDLEKLFVSFQQVDSKRNRTAEGTGLGLAISKSLCQAMGGSIGVTSEYGKGSDFYFSIPQKVLDPSSELVVEDAEDKYAYCFNDSDKMTDMFIAEVNRFGVEGKVIHSLEEYEPTGKRDYLFFEETRYREDIRELLDRYPECIGVILVAFASDFVADKPNLHIMRRPETTLSMVMTLNNKDISQRTMQSNEAFQIDFITPDVKILIVDDNAINITIAAGLLQPLQAKCYSAGGGQEAIDKVRKENYDLILMDHMMPEVDGIEATKTIRSTIPSAANTPIIAVTANVMEGAREMFLKEGLNDLVAKPIDVRDLITKIKQWLPEEKMLKGEAARQALEQQPKAEEENIEYDGLNYENAVRALGSPALYQKIVQEYYRTGEAKYENIQEAYEREDWTDYKIKVHALKSSSRQIGAEILGDMAEQLEKAANALVIETIRGKNDEMLGAYRELLDGLSKYFPEEEASDEDLPPIEEDALKRILEELALACDELDMDGMEAVKEELKKYSYEEEVRAVMGELYEAIDNIDIDTCTELVEKINELIGS